LLESHPRTLTAEINEGLEWVICRKTTDKPVEFKPGRPRRTSSEPKKEGPGRDKNQRWVTHLEVQSFKLVSSPFWLGPQFKIVAYTEIPEHFPTDPRERIPIYEALPTKEIATSPYFLFFFLDIDFCISPINPFGTDIVCNLILLTLGIIL